MNNLYTIGQLAKLAGISTKTLRVYERKGLLVPERNADNSYRLYGEEAVRTLEKIQLMKWQDVTLDQIAKIHKERGITVILVSHSMEDVANYVQRIIVMNDGEVALDDVPKRVFRYAKELDSIGLAVPQVTAVMNSLRDAGIPTGKDATTVEEARDELLQLYRNQR